MSFFISLFFIYLHFDRTSNMHGYVSVLDLWYTQCVARYAHMCTHVHLVTRGQPRISSSAYLPHIFELSSLTETS